MAQSNPKRDAIEKCIALKKMPHIFEKLKNVWGYPEFFAFVDSLLLVEPGRDRAGFPEGVYKELDALERIFLKFPEDVAAPELDSNERAKLKAIIREKEVKLNYTIGDR